MSLNNVFTLQEFDAFLSILFVFLVLCGSFFYFGFSFKEHRIFKEKVKQVDELIEKMGDKNELK